MSLWQYLVGYPKWNKSKIHQGCLCRPGEKQNRKILMRPKIWFLSSLQYGCSVMAFEAHRCSSVTVSFCTWNLKRFYFRYNGCFRSVSYAHANRMYFTVHPFLDVYYVHHITLWAEIKGKHDHLSNLKWYNLLQNCPFYHSLHIYYLCLNAIIEIARLQLLPEDCKTSQPIAVFRVGGWS